MIELPTKVEPPKSQGLKKLCIYGHTKVGKTKLFTKLPNCLIIDLESGAHTYDGMIVDVKKMAYEKQMSVVDVLRDIAVSIEAKNREHGKPFYDYIVIDTVTALEEYAIELATRMYKQTTIGKNYKGTNVIRDLEMGLGYTYLRDAFRRMYEAFEMLPAESLILVGHVRASAITKDGKNLSVRDLDLTGKNKRLLAKEVDNIGFMYRDKSGVKNYLSFKRPEDDIASGARAEHLQNKEFMISELNQKGELTTHWDLIFPKLKS